MGIEKILSDNNQTNTASTACTTRRDIGLDLIYNGHCYDFSPLLSVNEPKVLISLKMLKHFTPPRPAKTPEELEEKIIDRFRTEFRAIKNASASMEDKMNQMMHIFQHVHHQIEEERYMYLLFKKVEQEMEE